MAGFSSTVGPPTGAGGSSRPIVRPPSRSITQQAIAGHPAWATPTPTIQSGGPWVPARPPAAQAPPAGAPAPTHPVTTSTPAAPPDMSGAKWMGYLTPDQLGQLNAASTTYGINVGAQSRRSGVQLDANNQPTGAVSPSGDAEIQYNQTVQAAQHQHDVQQAQANEALAARGLFQSSIRANDLADIDAAMVQRQITAKSALDTLIADATDAIGRLNAGWGSTQLSYQGLAGQNAAALPPGPPTVTTTQAPGPRQGVRPGPTGPSQAPAPAAQRPPTPGAPAAAKPNTPPVPKSITQQAIAGHPTWASGPRRK